MLLDRLLEKRFLICLHQNGSGIWLLISLSTPFKGERQGDNPSCMESSAVSHGEETGSIRRRCLEGKSAFLDVGLRKV